MPYSSNTISSRYLKFSSISRIFSLEITGKNTSSILYVLIKYHLSKHAVRSKLSALFSRFEEWCRGNIIISACLVGLLSTYLCTLKWSTYRVNRDILHLKLSKSGRAQSPRNPRNSRCPMSFSE